MTIRFTKCFYILVTVCILYVVWKSNLLQFKKNVEGLIEEDVHHEEALQRKLVLNQWSKPVIDLVVIFTKVSENYVLQFNLKRALSSLLKRSTSPIRLHLISDEAGYNIAMKIIREEQILNQLDEKYLKIVLVSPNQLSEDVKPMVETLQQFFTRNENSYYRDFLFFFSLFLPQLLPGTTNIVMMDIDVLVKGDISELVMHFNNFNESQIIGMGPELSPVYYHMLEKYRKSNPKTRFGMPHSEGGFSGFNSGVMLINIPKLKESSIIQSYLRYDVLKTKTEKYMYHGDLGDQDLYTLMYFDHPELFYTLPCEWNRQRCEWWRTRGYEDKFDRFFKCENPPKIIHGNCKSKIPEDS